MPKRASLRHESGPRRVLAPGSMFSAGHAHVVEHELEVTDARSDSFLWISGALNPGVPFSTMKPRISPSPVRAQTIAMSAIVPFVIHIFVPLRIQSSPSRRACVRIVPGSEPASGSVSPKQPITSPVCIRGSHCSFCSSEPQRQIAYIASEPWTETSAADPGVPRLELRAGEAVRDGARTRKPVPVEMHPEEAQLRELARSPRAAASPARTSRRPRARSARARTGARCRESPSPRRPAARPARGSRGGRARVALRSSLPWGSSACGTRTRWKRRSRGKS